MIFVSYNCWREEYSLPSYSTFMTWNIVQSSTFVTNITFIVEHLAKQWSSRKQMLVSSEYIKWRSNTATEPYVKKKYDQLLILISIVLCIDNVSKTVVYFH